MTFTISGPATITWNWQTQYQVTFTPGTGGSITTPATSPQWYDSGASGISIAASHNSNYAFSSWTCNPTGSVTFVNANSASTTITINAAGAITTNFVSTPIHYIDTNNAVHDTNVGSHSNFAYMKDIGNYDTLTEANVGGGTGTFGSSTGSSTTSYSSSDFYGSLYTSPADAGGATISSLTAYCSGRYGTVNIKAVIVRHSDMVIIGVSDATSCSTTAADRTFTFSTPVTISASTEYVIGLIADGTFYFYYSSGSTNQGHYDTTNSYTTPSDPTDYTHNSNAYRTTVTYNKPNNYQLDLEVQFSSVTNFASYTQLQIQTGAFTNTETIYVDYWTGSAWSQLGTLTASSPNTFTSNIWGSSYELRFRDGTTTGDTTQSTWQIDYVRLVAP